MSFLEEKYYKFIEGAEKIQLTQEQMFKQSRKKEVPNNWGVKAYITERTGRSVQDTVDNIENAGPKEEKIVKEFVDYATQKKKENALKEIQKKARKLGLEQGTTLEEWEEIAYSKSAHDLVLNYANRMREANEEEKKDFRKELNKKRALLFGLRKDIVRHKNNPQFIEVVRDGACDPDLDLPVKSFISKEYGRLAAAFHSNFSEYEGSSKPVAKTVFAPEWRDSLVLFEPETRTTFILGVDYAGEIKKATMRAVQHHWTQEKRGLGVHAGSKEYVLENDRKGAIVFGLSGTGKTTTCLYSHPKTFKPPEAVNFKQDDMLLLNFNGEAHGMEEQFYIKTDSVNEKYQKPLKKALKKKERVAIENVAVKNGEFNFDDTVFEPNGRAFIPRENVPNSDPDPDLENADVLFFNTRGPFPPMQLLKKPDQAATFFALGESVKTAGTVVGVTKPTPVNTMGFDPFTPKGFKEQRINAFREWLKKNPGAKVVVLNTGRVNKKPIKPEDTFRMMEAVVRDQVEWSEDKVTGTKTPDFVKSIDINDFDPYKQFGKKKYRKKIEKLTKHRKKFLEQNFPDINWFKLKE